MDIITFRKLFVALFVVSFISTYLIGEISAQCSSHQFKCHSNKCIPLGWQCDDEDDCGDGSDEVNCEARTCSNTEFPCANGRCVPSRWQCDNEDDCGDKSDENPDVCQQRTCKPDQFACHSPVGVCIPITWHCDGQNDCVDGSDEADCHQITCSEEEFTCDDNKCITKRWLCDQDNDCRDKSDEQNCPNVTCSSSEFMCDNGKCIPARWRCDSSTDCSDESDEKYCPTTGAPASLCNPREFMCANKKDCIHMTWQCDGEQDCPDGSDEQNCNNTCRPDQFQCKNLQCIPGQLQCNGKAECPDNSDEDDCNIIYPEKCDPDTQFDCGNHCIPVELVCDGKNDCRGWEDEPSDLCKINECSNDNGGCSQICVDLPVGFRCACRKGFRLADNQTCEDIDECDVPGSCSQICHNTKGSYKCECFSGYVLEPSNMHRCRAEEGHPALLFANRQDIRKIDLETQEYVSLVSNLHSAIAIDYDFRTGTIVWSDVAEEKIKSAPIDTGTPVTTIISDKIMTADGIAVDWIYGHIYWTDTGKNTIEMADKSGKMRKTLIDKNLDEPRAIVLNPLDGWMYWTDWGEPAQLERAGMDGSHRSAIVSSDILWPNGLAIDFVMQKIFWADAKLHTVSCADFNGNNQRVVLYSPIILKHPFSIDVFEDWIYWTDWESEAIHKMNKFNGNNKTDVFNGVPSPMDVHIYHHFKQPDGENYCKNMHGRCSHLCLPSPNITSHSARYTCACPDGMKLTEDGVTCIPMTVAPTVSASSSAMPATEEHAMEASESSSVSNFETAEAETVQISGNRSVHAATPQTQIDKSRMIGIILGALSGIIFILSLVAFLIYKHYLRKNVTSMNFDNPVYRKTTEDQFSLEKNQYHPARSYPPNPNDLGGSSVTTVRSWHFEVQCIWRKHSGLYGNSIQLYSLEPLTSPGTNEFV